MGGGAWPFLVGGVICLLNCVNERDLNLLNKFYYNYNRLFLEGLHMFNMSKFKAITGL